MTIKVKRELILEGLDCANCAAKIEKKVNEIEGVDSASMNFVTNMLTIETQNTGKFEEILNQVKGIVKKYEPHVNVVVEHDRVRNVVDTSITKNEKLNDNRKEIYKLLISTIIFLAALIFKFDIKIEFTLFFISYIIVGGEVLLKAARNIIKGQVFDENFLMSLATIGAFAIKQFPEGVAVMLFYQVGEYIQDIAVNRSRKSISALMDIRPDYANLKIDGELKRVSPEDVKIGDFIIVKPGEKIPLDGNIVEGKSMVDTSALSGESVPREACVGSEVLSGFINKNGLITVKVAKEFGESTVSKILDLVQNASSKKAPTENFITKFARYYTPAVVIIATIIAVVPPLVISEATFSHWIYKGLVFLVISCPCALVISIPLGFFGGIGGASKRGILVKGSNYLEALNNVSIVVFDKTGTLTKGVFKVTHINAMNGISGDELLEYAAYAEAYSNHPIALSILKQYGKEINKIEIEGYSEISGKGIKVKVKNKEILAGNDKLMFSENIAFESGGLSGTVVYIAVDAVYAGYIIISDEIKADSKEAIKELKRMGIKKTVMLTGDNRIIAAKVAKELGIDEFYAELLPHEKVEWMETIGKQRAEKEKLLFVGDGINDAPVIALADVGIAMGGLGSDAAIEAADIVIMTDEPSKVALGIKIAKRTRRIIWQNIIFAISIKLIVLALATVGIATIWEGVFADVGVTVIAVINAMRAINVENI